MRNVKIAVLLIVLMFLVGCTSQNSKYDESMLIIPLDSAVSSQMESAVATVKEYILDLEHSSGDITVSTWDEVDKIGIKLLKTAHGSNPEVLLDQTDVTYNWLDEVTIDVDSIMPAVTGDEDVRIDFEIYFPKEVLIKLRSQSSEGNINIDNILGSVEAETSNGDISIAQISSEAILYVETSNGDIIVKDVQAEQVEIFTSNGSIHLENIQTHVIAETSNGKINIDGATGILEVENSEGDITLTGIELADHGLIKSSDGHIILSLDSVAEGNYQVLTGNGNATIEFPQAISMDIYAEVGNGEITSNFLTIEQPQLFEGSYPENGAALATFSVMTSNGDISLNLK